MELLDKVRTLLRPGEEEDDYLDDYEKLPERGSARVKTRQEVSIRATANLKVMLVQPKGMQDLPGIADELRGGNTLVVNIEQSDRELARRILDFLSGVAYALDGRVHRIATDTYMVLPCSVEMEDSLMHELHDSGFDFGSVLGSGTL